MSGSLRRPLDLPFHEMVCDLCLRQGVRWTYVTRNNCTEEEYEQASRGVETETADGNPIFYCGSDPRWAVCEPCHKLLESRQAQQLFDRMMVGHQERKRIQLMRQLQRGDRAADVAKEVLEHMDATDAATRQSPALGLMRQMQMGAELKAVVVGVMTYTISVTPETLTPLDRVLATPWINYTPGIALTLSDATDDTVLLRITDSLIATDQ